MGQRIESDKLLVRDVFKRWYRIPEYQRPYVWETDQVLELLDDVYAAGQSNPDSQYFLGSLVLKKSEKQEHTTKFLEYDLLDGQQRLITLLLIHAVVRDMTPATKEARLNACRETIFQMANPDDNVPERIRIVFDIRPKVSDFVDEYVKTDNGTSRTSELKEFSDRRTEDISIRNMSQALLTIREYFQDGKSVEDLFPYLRSNVLIIYVAAEELEDAFHLFTVMNTRGIKLRNSDVLKASNLAKVPDAVERVKCAKEWEGIEVHFGEDFDTFLSHLRTILVKRKASYNLLREYEENVYNPRSYDRTTQKYTAEHPLLARGAATFEFVQKYYSHHQELFDDDKYGLTASFEFQNYRTLMKYGLEAEYWTAPLLRYFDKFRNDHLLDFLRLLDRKLSADWIVGISPTTRIDNANAIIQHIDDSSVVEEALSSPVYDVRTSDLIRVLATSSVYGRRFAKYLLLKLDLAWHGHTTRFSPPETITIEHILPQTPNDASQWVRDFDEQTRDLWTDRLGNLILLSRRKNTSQGNLDYTYKKQKYFSGNIELFSNSVRIFHRFGSWTLADLETNHTESVKKLLECYGVQVSDDDIGLLLSNGGTRTSRVQAYCMKCRAVRQIVNPKQVIMQNGKPAIQGSCSTCGTNVSRIGTG